MANIKLQCSVSYHLLAGEKLENLAYKVASGVLKHTDKFAAPPLSLAAFNTLMQEYHHAYEQYKNGGANQKGAYLTAKTKLKNALDALSKYVNELPDLNEELIVLSGFAPTKQSVSKSVAPDAPQIDKITMGSPGELIASCKKIAGVEYYGCLITDKPLASDSGIRFQDGMFTVNNFEGTFRLVVTKVRKKRVAGLKTMQRYWFYFFAGNFGGVSSLSEGKSQVCI